MRVRLHHIKVLLLLLLVVFLFGFSSKRNNARAVSELKINFLSEDNMFITQETVSKLLIQNQGGVTNKPKDIIDLGKLEVALNSNAMIKKAEVFLDVKGTLTAEIQQKQPLARINTSDAYYVDSEGLYMPLSSNYSARVPLVTGSVSKDHLQNIFTVAKTINNDEFLKKHIVEIHQNQDSTVVLNFRTHDFDVQLGTLSQLEKKINNLKAFYKKALKDNTLDGYSVVNLKFDNQVICTKK